MPPFRGYVWVSLGFARNRRDRALSSFARAGSEVFFTDLSNRLRGTMTTTDPDAQERTYQSMYKACREWRDFYPITNIQWTKYFYQELYGSEAFARGDALTRQTLDNLIVTIDQFTDLALFVPFLFVSANGSDGGQSGNGQGPSQENSQNSEA